MFSVIEYGSIRLGPRPRTFGMTPAIVAKQYGEHVENGHCSVSSNTTPAKCRSHDLKST